MGDQTKFSITSGPAKWTMVAVLGCATLGGLAWSLVGRSPAKQPQVLSALPASPSVPVAAITDQSASEPPTESKGSMESDAPAPVLVARPHANETPEAAPPAMSDLPEPKVVERSKIGPLPSEGAPLPNDAPESVPAPTIQEAPAPAAAPGQPQPDAPRASPLVMPLKINVNTATKAELELLPGIGPALADRIIEARTKKKFGSMDDLDKVRGIGPKMLEKLKGRIVFQDAPPPPPSRRGR